MNDAPFHTTRMGATFYEKTMPELLRQITRMNDLLERLATALEARPSKGKDA
jgi:hypothetical protein